MVPRSNPDPQLLWAGVLHKIGRSATWVGGRGEGGVMTVIRQRKAGVLEMPEVRDRPGQPWIARRQHGVFTDQQASAEGMSARHRRRLISDGLWVPVLAPVFRHCDTVESPWLRAQAAVLSGYPDRVVSHHTAAALWQLTIAESQDLHTIRRNGLGQPGLREHRLPLADSEKTVIGGLPVTTRHRTMVDLLCSCGHPDNVDWLVSEFRAGRLDQGALIEFERRIRGRTGAKRARALLDSCMGLPFSKLEWFFHRIARSISDVHWRFNVPLTDADGVVGLVDAVHDPGRLVVELDGEKFHGDDRFQADRTRDQRLQALGYVVLRFTWQDLTERSGLVAHRVRTVIDRGSRGLPR